MILCSNKAPLITTNKNPLFFLMSEKTVLATRICEFYQWDCFPEHHMLSEISSCRFIINNDNGKLFLLSRLVPIVNTSTLIPKPEPTARTE